MRVVRRSGVVRGTLAVTLLSSVVVCPAQAASHTISAGTVVYDSGTYGSDDIIVDGATALLQINSGGVPLTNFLDVENGGTLDNSGTIERSGPSHRGVQGGNGTVINRATGAIYSQNGTGILLYDGGSVTNSGLVDAAIYGIDIQGATGSVTNSNGGIVRSGSDGIILFSGGTVTNTGAGTIVENGVSILDGGGTLTNAHGAGIDGGVHMRDAAIVKNLDDSSITGVSAVFLEDGGSVTNDTDASIAGTDNGVKWDVDNDPDAASHLLTVDNSGIIKGTHANGIEAGTGDTLTDGTVSITNRAGGSIEGGGYGVVTSGLTTLTNNGTITGDTKSGVSVGAGSVTNSGAGTSISGLSSDGVFIANDAGTVTNEDGASVAGDYAGVELYYGGDVTNQSGGQILGNANGIMTWGGGTITNTGDGSLISATADPNAIGVDFTPYDDNPFLLKNEDGAQIVGGYAGAAFFGDGQLLNTGAGSSITANSYAVYYESTAGDVSNADHAAIDSLDGSGIALYAGGSVDNSGGATITGAVCGIFALGSVSITNSGTGSTISGDTCQGIYAEGDGSTVTNTDGASISGSGGIWLNGSSGTVTNSGTGSTITGTTGHGVAMTSGTVTNSDGAGILGGVYFSGAGTVNNKDGASISGGVAFDGAGTVSNTGGASISDGISFNTTGTLTNTASSITGSGYTVLLAQGGTVTNTGGGTISGGEIGVYIHDGGGTVTNGAGSTISGTTGIHAFGDTTVVNAGTIEGNVWLEDGAENHVTLYSGSKITGGLYVGSNSASTLTLTGDGDQLYSDAATDDTVFSSTVIKSGSGTWTIDKKIDAQVFDVEAGHLIIGTHGSGAVTATVYADPGTIVSGSGMLYGNLITEGATVAPGNSPGTLTIVGGYLQDAATTYAFELDRDTGIADKLVVTKSAPGASDGNAILQSGASLDVTQLGTGIVPLGTRYTVLSAENSLSGTFVLGGDLSVSAFTSLAASYDTNNAYLTAVQTRSLDAAAITPNQHATAGALQSGPAGNAAFRAVAALPDDATARNALDQLSGAGYADMQTGLLDAADPLRDAALARLRSALCARAGTCGPATTLWSRSYGAVLHPADGDVYTSGFIVGGDARGLFDGRGYAGLFASVGSTGIAGAGSTDLAAGGYGGVDLGGVRLSGGAAVSGHAIAVARTVAFPGYIAHLDSDYATYGTQLFGEASTTLALGEVDVSPFAGLAYAGISGSRFDEGSDGLSGEVPAASRTTGTLGLRASWQSNAVTVTGTLGWQHVLAATGGTAAVNFDSGPSFTVAAAPTPADSGIAGLDLEVRLGDNAHLTLGYNGSFAPGGSQQSATAALRMQF